MSTHPISKVFYGVLLTEEEQLVDWFIEDDDEGLDEENLKALVLDCSGLNYDAG